MTGAEEVALAEAVAAQREAERTILTHIGGAAGVELTPLDSGGVAQAFRVRETDTHYIDVVEQLFNWRVCSTFKPHDGLFYYDAGYCYLGKGVASFTRAVLGAAVWDGPEHGDPPGWDKNAFTGEWRRDREGEQ